MRRIRVRTLMMLVAVLAVLMGSVGPGRRSYRRWCFYRSQAAVYARLEQAERLREIREQSILADREAMKAMLRNSPLFDPKSSTVQEKEVDAAIEFHRLQSKEARLAAERWQENRRQNETAALWCWDPYAPDVP